VGGIPIAVRHIESVLRMSEAYAKMHLRDYVRAEDIDFAIQMLLQSFLQSQKESVKRVLAKKFQAYFKPRNDNWSVLHHELCKLVNLQVATSKL
jgi:DNA replication licensing factor MCM2